MATESLLQYCDEFIVNHREYAAAQGYEYKLYQKKHRDFVDFHPVYSRIGFVLDALEAGYDPIVAIDMDAAFMNYTWDIGTLLIHSQVDVGRWPAGYANPILEKSPGCWLAGYNQSNWPSNYLCFGLLVYRNNWMSKAFLKEVWRRSLVNPEIDSAREQYYGYDVLAQMSYAGVRACTAEEIGCFAKETWNDGTRWWEGYPTVHIACAPWEQRQELFHDVYLPQVKKV